MICADLKCPQLAIAGIAAVVAHAEELSHWLTSAMQQNCRQALAVTRQDHLRPRFSSISPAVQKQEGRVDLTGSNAARLRTSVLPQTNSLCMSEQIATEMQRLKLVPYADAKLCTCRTMPRLQKGVHMLLACCKTTMYQKILGLLCDVHN